MIMSIYDTRIKELRVKRAEYELMAVTHRNFDALTGFIWEVSKKAESVEDFACRVLSDKSFSRFFKANFNKNILRFCFFEHVPFELVTDELLETADYLYEIKIRDVSSYKNEISSLEDENKAIWKKIASYYEQPFKDDSDRSRMIELSFESVFLENKIKKIESFIEGNPDFWGEFTDDFVGIVGVLPFLLEDCLRKIEQIDVLIAVYEGLGGSDEREEGAEKH